MDNDDYGGVVRGGGRAHVWCVESYVLLDDFKTEGSPLVEARAQLRLSLRRLSGGSQTLLAPGRRFDCG
jgi:hypothetical protein